MEVLNRIFSGVPGDTARVNYIGVAIILAGLVVGFLSRRISGAVPEKNRERVYWALRLSGLLLVAIGTLTAMKFIF